MKKFYPLIIGMATAALLINSCASSTTAEMNDSNKRYFDSWVHVQKQKHPEYLWEETSLGAYILEMKCGDKTRAIGDQETSPYLYGSRTFTDLDGNVTSTSEASVSQQIGTYDESSYYGNKVWYRGENNLPAGIDDVLEGMYVGDTVTIACPGWLSTTNRYDSAEEYLKNESGDDGIYTLCIVDAFSDVAQWELDSLDSYVRRNFPGTDSTMLGFYYIQTQAPSDTTTFVSNDYVALNYTGRLLNGNVFDTNLKDTAKVYHLYSTDNTYEEFDVSWNDDFTYIRSSDYTPSTSSDSDGSTTSSDEDTDISDIIYGFRKCISLMRTGEKGICVFHSAYGYEADGSGDAIPQYSPLRFDIEIIGITELDRDSDEK